MHSFVSKKDFYKNKIKYFQIILLLYGLNAFFINSFTATKEKHYHLVIYVINKWMCVCIMCTVYTKINIYIINVTKNK